ncbi:MAG: two pore domain potassium channel family protein [Burkholderiales bacterium]|nr:two pore domain potassium channel family protein [Burkholderiales bacterium]MDE2394153.1 two pore domain potassium channel family protein [Burkholderiales bacterium]MDE2452146.1 two pore domain potassium channel family protein [Burkholderiales bacterium]
MAYLLLLALAVLFLCGAGFWWLEPSVHSLGDGVWLAFTTAATVGYGDVVPTSTAAKIFAVFVVLLGLGVLTTVTAAIAATWVETEERRAQRELLRRLSNQLDSVRAELAALRAETRSAALLQAERREKSKRQPM